MNSTSQNNAAETPQENRKAGTGNASNPAPHNDSFEPSNKQQVLNEKAEKYLRESASIEDMPDAKDEAEAEKDSAV